jgi:hypothetical protein
MEVSASPESAIAAALDQRDSNVSTQIQVSLLKKAQDQMKLEGAAMIELINQSVIGTPQSATSLLDTYA